MRSMMSGPSGMQSPGQPGNGGPAGTDAQRCAGRQARRSHRTKPTASQRAPARRRRRAAGGLHQRPAQRRQRRTRSRLNAPDPSSGVAMTANVPLRPGEWRPRRRPAQTGPRRRGKEKEGAEEASLRRHPARPQPGRLGPPRGPQPCGRHQPAGAYRLLSGSDRHHAREGRR